MTRFWHFLDSKKTSTRVGDDYHRFGYRVGFKSRVPVAEKARELEANCHWARPSTHTTGLVMAPSHLALG